MSDKDKRFIGPGDASDDRDSANSADDDAPMLGGETQALQREPASPAPKLSLDARRLEALYTVSRAISALMPLDELWDLFYRETTTVIPGDAFSISIFDETTDMAQSLFSIDTVDGRVVREGQGEPYSIQGRFLEHIIRSRKGDLILRKKGEEENLGLVRFGNKSQLSMSLMFAPMVSGNRVLGAVSVQSYSENAYGQADLALLEAIAASGALALQNSRLYSTLSEQRDQLSSAHDRLREAHQRQQEEIARMRRALDDMRWGLPELPGWEIARHERTAEEVGGDYSLFWRNEQDNMISFIVADASGHGPSAAVYTAMTHVEAVAALQQGLAPDAVLHMLNSRLTKALPPSGFVTVACGRVHGDTGQVEYASAGHPRALVWRAGATKADFWDVKNGPAIGISEGAEFPINLTHLNPGDKMLLYTDGLIETCSPGLDEFGEDNIREAMMCRCGEKPEKILEEIDSRTVAWRQRPVPEDDCLMVLLARKNSHN